MIYSKEKWDLLSISILLTIIACIITAFAYNIPSGQFVNYIQFKPILYLIASSIIILLVESQNIFQVQAIKIIKFTQSNPRLLFYFMCFLGMFLSSIVEDVSVALILIPLIIRACRLLHINSKPFIYGIAICLNFGNMMAPFSNSQNIILSDAFGLDVPWFATNMIPFVILGTLITVVVLDLTMLKQQKPPTDVQIKLLNELMELRLLVKDRKMYNVNLGIFLGIICGFLIIPATYIVALIGALILCLVNKQEFAQLIRKIDWKVLGFFIVLFLIVGCMIINGTMAWVGQIMVKLTTDNVFIASIVILIASSIIASILSPNPTNLLFIPIFDAIFTLSPSLGMNSAPIFIAFLTGLNLGNFLPQGAPCYLVTLNICETQKETEINYPSMAKIGIQFTFLHILISIIYLLLYCWILDLL